MSEKPEALMLAEELYAFHAAKKEMPSVGGQMLGLESYRIVATGEAFSQILDAAAKLCSQHEEIERLRELLNRLEYSSDGHIKRYPEEEEVNAALRGDKT